MILLNLKQMTINQKNGLSLNAQNLKRNELNRKLMNDSRSNHSNSKIFKIENGKKKFLIAKVNMNLNHSHQIDCRYRNNVKFRICYDGQKYEQITGNGAR